MTPLSLGHGWRDARRYARLAGIDRAGLMWEWLRRDPAYIAWQVQASVATRGAADVPGCNDPVQWGIHFRRGSGARRAGRADHLACRLRSRDIDRPAWRPLRAFDDGRQTFIEFPATLGVGEAPPLFLVGEKGEAQLVNYRLRGAYYVVDRLFDVAELRLGAKNQAIVRIRRLTPRGARKEG